MSRSPREVAEQVRRMVAGEGVDFADLFAEDGVLAYPFGLPGQPAELNGREAIRAYFKDRSRSVIICKNGNYIKPLRFLSCFQGKRSLI